MGRTPDFVSQNFKILLYRILYRSYFEMNKTIYLQFSTGMIKCTQTFSLSTYVLAILLKAKFEMASAPYDKMYSNSTFEAAVYS